jgi:hypothetical protein
MGVPGPTRVSRAFSSTDNIYPSLSLAGAASKEKIEKYFFINMIDGFLACISTFLASQPSLESLARKV